MPSGTCEGLLAKGEEVVGMDLFDWPGTFGQLRDRLAGTCALDALREGEPTEFTRPEVAQRFLRRVGDCIRRRADTLGLGQEFEVAGRGIVGTALTYAGRICHLAAFIMRVQTT